MPEIKPIIYTEDVRRYLDPEKFREGYSLLPPCRRAKIDRLRFEKDKCLSLGAGLLLRRALLEAGLPLTEEDTVTGEHGKPYFPGCGDRFSFSLSHSGTMATCAVLPGRGELGCDLEMHRDISLRVAKHFFAEEEYELIMREPDREARLKRFFRIWVMKEAFLKATGLGLSLPLKDFIIFFDENDRPLISQHVDCRSYILEEPAISPEYACAICTAGPSPATLSVF